MFMKNISVNFFSIYSLNTSARIRPLNYLISFMFLTCCLFFLLLIPKQAHAACTYTGTSASTYTAASYGNPATLTFTGTWRCQENGTYGTSRYTCLKPVFSSPMTGSNASYTLPYTVTATAGATATGSNATTGKWYGPGTTTVSNNYMNITLSIAVPAPSTILPAGTYSSTLKLYVDMQAASGTVCEGGDGNGWDSGSIDFTFNYVVPPICYLTSVTDIDFGNITDAGVTDINYDANGAVVTRCNVNRRYSIYLGDGNNRITGGNRRMVNGSNYLAYQLYKEAARTNIWDNTGGVTATGGSGGVASTGTGSNQTFPVYGRIPQGISIPPAGNYTDTVVVTVAY